jgi:hypothetical protein
MVPGGSQSKMWNQLEPAGTTQNQLEPASSDWFQVFLDFWLVLGGSL